MIYTSCVGARVPKVVRTLPLHDSPVQVPMAPTTAARMWISQAVKSHRQGFRSISNMYQKVTIVNLYVLLARREVK